MSEVMRWKLKGFIPGVDGVSKALFQPWVVPAEDFDRVVAERDALQLRLNSADQRIDDLEELLVEAHRSVDYHAGMQREDGGERLYGLLSRISKALKLEQSERDHQTPGTSGVRLNMLANQGE
ncbi:hypothetical protein [Pseudomonas sp.]|uniref:hypothetical protein n=1 Tax=Pseudomonas sp. TaxID=306 RepID=UPI0032631E71